MDLSNFTTEIFVFIATLVILYFIHRNTSGFRKEIIGEDSTGGKLGRIDTKLDESIEKGADRHMQMLQEVQKTRQVSTDSHTKILEMLGNVKQDLGKVQGSQDAAGKQLERLDRKVDQIQQDVSKDK